MDPRRRLPQVDRLAEELASEARDLPRAVVVEVVRGVVDRARNRARRSGDAPDPDAIRAEARDEIASRRARLLVRVVNATGVIVHTNLGRAPLPAAAAEAIATLATGYTNLEFDLASGRRGDRFEHVEPLIALATGAQAALVVNNNAAAVLLVCAALAEGREVVISRGELIEIGGSFRIPDVLERSGATLREVGTTNRTRAEDYTEAVDDATAMILVVHPSNYRVVGFAAAPSLSDVAKVAKGAKVPLVLDAGSGLLPRALGDEPVVGEALRDGADLVCFSGDKLLGGPQAGIVVGRRALVERLRTHPLLRALRPDKLILAALEVTVRAYLDGEHQRLPVWRMIDAPYEDLTARAGSLADALGERGYRAEVVEGASVVGGGSLPGHELPSPTLRVTRPDKSPTRLAAALRAHRPPVVARVEDAAVVIDLRTVQPDEDATIAAAFGAAGER